MLTHRGAFFVNKRLCLIDLGLISHKPCRHLSAVKDCLWVNIQCPGASPFYCSFGASKPLSLLQDIRLMEFLVRFCDINNALNKPDHTHGYSGQEGNSYAHPSN